MKSQDFLRKFVGLALGFGIVMNLSACAGEGYFDQLTVQSTGLSGYIVVAGSATPLGAPGTVALFDPNGNLVRQIKDHYADTELTSGLAVFGNVIYTLIDGSDRVEAVNAQTAVATSWVNNPNISSALRHMAIDSSGYLYIAEYNTGNGQIEKADLGGQRVGSPFIGTTTGSCTMVNPFGIAFIPTVNRIVVTNYSGGNLLFYNANAGTCASSVANAQYSGGNPTGIVYHPQTNKLLITKLGTDNVITANVDGTSPTVAYSNTTRVQDPYDVAVDSQGYVYVASAVQDSIEKFSFNGTTLTPVQGGPWISTGIYTLNPVAIEIIP